MEAIVVGAALAGSFVTALVLQKVALEALLRAMDADRRAK
jgi:hypothetical protein